MVLNLQLFSWYSPCCNLDRRPLRALAGGYGFPRVLFGVFALDTNRLRSLPPLVLRFVLLRPVTFCGTDTLLSSKASNSFPGDSRLEYSDTYVEFEIIELTEGGFLYGPIPSSCSAKYWSNVACQHLHFVLPAKAVQYFFSFINKSVKANGPKRENCNVYLPPDEDAACPSRYKK